MLQPDERPPTIDAKSFRKNRKFLQNRDKKALNGELSVLIKRKVSFFLEYPFDGAHCQILSKLKQAVKKGYKLVLFYIGLDDPLVAIHRIRSSRRKRDYVENARIMFSYKEQLMKKCFKKISSVCSDLYLIDNRVSAELYCYVSGEENHREVYMEVENVHTGEESTYIGKLTKEAIKRNDNGKSSI